MKKRLKPIENFDQLAISREMDRVKARVFLDSKNPYAAFYSSVLFTLDLVWTNDIPYAATDGRYLYWNPSFFEACSAEVSATILLHEIDHVARMHMVRKGDRNHKLWNIACDIRINNNLDKMNYSFKGIRPWIKHSVDATEELSEEDIYDLLEKGATFVDVDGNTFGDEMPSEEGQWGDIFGDLTEEEKHEQIRNIIIAVQTTEQSGGKIPGGTKEIIERFLKPVVPWQQTFHKFFKDLLDEDYTWRRPSRRSIDVYLPDRYEDEGRLEHLMYAIDVSGSITAGDKLRFNSELKYVWDELKPKRMTIIQFDTEITHVIEKKEGEDFHFLEIIGGGGTDLEPVREWIAENNPTAGVVFSDLECDPMDCSGLDIPMIWVCVNNKSASVEKGTLIHIR